MEFLKYSLFMVLLILSACGKNLDDYNLEELDRKIAELKQVEGRYTGLVRSAQDNSEIMGALALDISVETRSVDSSATNKGPLAANNVSAEKRAVLITQVEFYDFQKISIVSKDGYYDPRSQQFQTNIAINKTTGGVEDLSISAKLVDNLLKGKIEITGFKDFGFNFQLQKDGQELERLYRHQVLQGDEEGQGFILSQRFKGQTLFRNSRISPLELIITQESLSSDEDFLNKFIPIKSVYFTLNYGNGLLINHPNTRWDTRTGILTATVKTNASSLSTECRSNGKSPELIWNCFHTSSSLGLVASTIAVDLKNPQEFETDNFSERSLPTRSSFTGTFTSGENGSQEGKSSLLVTLPAETRATQIMEEFFPIREKAVFATIELNAGITVAFPASSTIWDKNTGNLNGTTESVSGSDRAILTLQCSQFFMNRTSEDFTCEYTSSRLFYPFNFKFIAPL